ncbi:DUF4439 domain-containing protein [Arthrobacter sp. M4]|uniref:DUF4439 domain-containing protein n=1 Tax=Arthrobacter sp. M4 TaxID=218160 RepID=UPI001CDC8236|nr:DUF4439 domain-containing protein [Arthrobacter sp. M4]MCA4134609.1 ferritin-like domain-containing protein [Arthrobacter sp. M4]
MSEGKDSADRTDGLASTAPPTGQKVRMALAGVTAAVVLGLGATLIPAQVPPPEPSFSDTARKAAFTDTLSLLEDAGRLTESRPSESAADMLSLHARALQRPGVAPSATSSAPASSTATEAGGSAATGTASRSTAAASATGSTTAGTTVADPTGFVSRLATSAMRRLADAARSDGGTGRLLAAVGTAQFLKASDLAASWRLPAPSSPEGSLAAPPTPSSPTQVPTADNSPTATGSGVPGCGALQRQNDSHSDPAPSANLAGALAMAARSEAEAVYVYQVAQTRLDPDGGKAAAALLAAHQSNVRRAEELSRTNCVPAPPREAGYQLPAALAAKPSTALAELETGLMDVYADVVAFGSSDAKAWGVSQLLASGQRARSWGGTPGSFPGLALNKAELPQLEPGAGAATP